MHIIIRIGICILLVSIGIWYQTLSTDMKHQPNPDYVRFLELEQGEPDQYKYSTMVRLKDKINLDYGSEFGSRYDLDAKLARMLARLKARYRRNGVDTDTMFFFPSHPEPVSPSFSHFESLS